VGLCLLWCAIVICDYDYRITTRLRRGLIFAMPSLLGSAIAIYHITTLTLLGADSLTRPTCDMRFAKCGDQWRPATWGLPIR